jgi:cysteine synthase
MNSKRLYFLLLGCLILLFVGMIGGAYGANKFLAQKANALTSLKAQSQALDRQQQALNTAKSQIKQYADLQKITQSVVPQEKNTAAAVREIVNIATAQQITLVNIAFPASTLGNKPTAAGASSGAAAAAAAPTATKDLSQLVPVKTIPGVYQLTISVSNDSIHTVTYQQFINFLAALEKDRHTAQVTTLSLTPDPNNRTFLTFTLNIVEYVKP